VLCAGHLSVVVEVEATSSAASTEGPVAAPLARRSGVRVDVAVVGGRHFFASVCVMSRRFKFVSC